MLKRSCTILLAAWLLSGPLAARADDAATVFARYKAASGGARWDSVTSLRTNGSLKAGGLEGEFESTQDLATGRSTDHYTLGPIKGANGYDGHIGWTRTPGGEVAALDAPEAKRRARSQAWLDTHGYWYPTRIGASYAKPERRELDGKHYLVIEATPEGGDPISLWFEADTNLLARAVQRQGQDTATTQFDDYREVNGLRLPFHLAIDMTDAAGRTDPRARSEVLIDRVTINIAIADTDFAMPAMTASARIDNTSGITRIPFDLVSNHIYVDGSVDGKKARFLVDTGGVNLLTPAAAKKFGLAGEGKLAVRGVGDDMVDMAMAHASEVRVGDAVLAKPVFYVIDLGNLAATEGVDCDGLVGYEMFSRFGVTIDYAKRELVLAEPTRFAPPVGAHAIPFELAGRIPIITGTLDGVPARLSVDTGSRVSLTLHSPFVHTHDLIARYDATAESVIGWGVGGPSRGHPARFGTLRLGDLAIDGIAGDLYTGNKGAFASPDVSGNLGGGVFKRFTIAFDYAAKRIYLAPNVAYGKPDNFDRSGLFLLTDGDALKIADVAGKSAAARAGLHADDRILMIGGDKITSHTLDEWRQQLRELPVGTKTELTFERAGATRKTTLELADRIPAQTPKKKSAKH
jgi:hypothetical protein